MLSKHKHHFKGNLITELHSSDSHFLSANCSDCSDTLLKLCNLLRFWSTKPSSITETSKNCNGIELARGISVIFAEKNSHLLLRHRDVDVLFTAMHFGESCISSEASNSLTDTVSQGSVTQHSMPQYPRVPSCSSINAGPEPEPEPEVSSSSSSSSRGSSEERNAMMIPPPDSKKSMRTQIRSVIIPYALDEIWSSEEYTCVVVHGDQKPAVTHIFCDYVLECHARWMVGRKRIPTMEPFEDTKSPEVPTVHHQSSDNNFILSFCSMCDQRPEKEDDIYLFQGEAFCSPVCRNDAVVDQLWAEEERKVRVDHRSQGPPEPADSDDKNLFTLGIPIIT